MAARGKSIARKTANVAFVVFCTGTALIAIGALAAILYSLLTHGVGGLNADVFTMSTPAPGSRGGLINAIVGSIMMCVLGMVIALALGILAGTWLAEYGGDSLYAKVVRFLNDVLLSAPSILVGLVVYYVMVANLIHHFSGYAGAVALGLIAAPLVTRATEDVLKLQPPSLRESGVALGSPVWTTIRKIMWRAAAPGLVTGGLLGFARISGETAPLLFTSLNQQFLKFDLSQPTSSLPVVIYNFALSAYDDWVRLAWVGALLIAASVLATQIIARILIREQSRS
jgi:phosphate transport system permease protein